MCVKFDGNSKFRGSKTRLDTVSTALPSCCIIHSVNQPAIQSNPQNYPSSSG
jgi:hypothetical protein